MFKKILIANRGEIAVRVMQTCKRLGIGTVAVYSDPDFRSLHVAQADEAVPLGGARPTESYLNKEKILKVAQDTGCQAIHPGYGFLSENAAFADRVTAAGITFIGPSGPVIARLGDKIASKQLAIQAGVPTVPGHVKALSSYAEAQAVAAEVGYPILLKPAAGGGGKGMRTVERPEDLASALKVCQQETLKAFGDDTIFIERYITAPRHIEIQVMADAHATPFTWASANARSSAVTRKSSRSPLPWPWMPNPGHEWAKWPAAWRVRPAMSTPVPWNSSLTTTGSSIFWR